ncbi:MAG: hypothetical protein B6D55_06320 [Candidatus Omnitrophica bacterium 4484_70.2]|nr:MAG: hypothetical protein B6D55_06320 [Candidatus Omnitrophica bacterium 4484_70.2]
MHSRVFVLLAKDNIFNENYGYPIADEIVNQIPEADFCGQGDLEKDIKWFKKVYGEDTVGDREEFSIKDNDVIVGYKLNAEVFKKSLEKNFTEILKKVTKVLLKKDDDIFKKAQLIEEISFIVNPGGFYFYIDGYGVMSEVDLVLYALEDFKEYYIIDTFDYHF